MKKNLILISFIVLILIFFSISNSFCEIVRATITGTKDNKLYVATDEEVIINAGKNYGIIKGDILPIYKKGNKPSMVDEIGRCVIIKNDEDSSVCHIIKSRIEAGNGDFVLINKPTYSDFKIYSLINTTLNEIVEPYENYKQIRIYLHNIYDEKNNITEFSKIIKEELFEIFKRKERLIIDIFTLNEYMNYQDYYFYYDTDRSKQERIFDLKKKMEQFKIDVAVTGFYVKKSDGLMVKLFIVDKNYGDKSVKISIPYEPYADKISKIVKPYQPFKEKEFVDYKFVLNIKDYLPDVDEQREIIRHESEKELSFRYKFANSKLKFNRISPSDINIKVNNEMIRNIQKGDIYEKTLEKGIKRIFVSFIPTLYDNELEIISLKKEVKKEILLDLTDENDIFIEIYLDSTYGNESVDIKVVKKKTEERIKIVPVKTVIEKGPSIELYRD